MTKPASRNVQSAHLSTTMPEARTGLDDTETRGLLGELDEAAKETISTNSGTDSTADSSSQTDDNSAPRSSKGKGKAVQGVGEASDDDDDDGDSEEEEDEDEGDDEDDEDDEDEEDEEPKLKYARLTQHLGGLYRNGDATSTFVVSGDKMVNSLSGRDREKYKFIH